jgi:hypothetical protein
MRQPVRAIVRWTAVEVLVVQTVGAWLAMQVAWLVTWPASWAVYVLAGREGSRHGHLRYAALAGGAVALVAHAASAARLAFKDIDPALGFGQESPFQVIVMTLAAGLWGGGWGLIGGFIGRLHQRRALLALLIGAGPVLVAVLQLNNVSVNAFTKFILWPVIVIGGLVPRHNIGTTDNPVYEGTPLNIAAATLGVVLCVGLYSAVAYAVLALIARGRARPGELNRVGA